MRQGHAEYLVIGSQNAMLPNNDSPHRYATTGLRGGSTATVRRQSIAASSRASCAGVSTMAPSTIGGQTSLPLSSRLAHKPRPVPSYNRVIRYSALLLRK